MTLVERLTRDGHRTERDARRHVRHGRVKVDGQYVTDPEHEVGDEARIVIYTLTPDDELELPDLDDEPAPAPPPAPRRRPGRKAG